MKLLMHTSEFPPGPGGIGAQAHRLARELVKLGWEIRVVVVQSYAEPAEVECFNREQPFEVVSLPEIRPAIREGLMRRRAVRQTINTWKPDLLLASGQRALWVAASVANRTSLQWVAIAHGTELDSRALWVKYVTRWALGRAQAVVVVSRFTGRFLRRLGVDRVPAYVVGNGADPELFGTADSQAVAELNRQLDLRDCKVILTVGNLTERKGQEIVVRALPRVLQRNPKVVYLMVGLPTEKRRLWDLAESLGVEEAVRFAGRLSNGEVVAALHRCDVLAMTSQHTRTGDFEGYGIAVVEAAMSGKPAVVSADSGLEEAVVAGETGLIVPQSNHEATAEALISILENDSLRSQMGRAARDRALAEQTWAARAAEYDRLFRGLVGRSDPQDRVRLEAASLP